MIMGLNQWLSRYQFKKQINLSPIIPHNYLVDLVLVKKICKRF